MKKGMHIMICAGTMTAVLFWAMATFAQSCSQDVECQQNKIEAMVQNPLGATLYKIKDLKKRLDGILKTQETDGDAKMANELDIYETEAEALVRSGEDSAIPLEDIQAGLVPVENRIIELERQSPGVQ